VQQTGKHLGGDLAEGKPTLPLIYTMQHGSAEQAAVVRNAIRAGRGGKIRRGAANHPRHRRAGIHPPASAALSRVGLCRYRRAVFAVTTNHQMYSRLRAQSSGRSFRYNRPARYKRLLWRAAG